MIKKYSATDPGRRNLAFITDLHFESVGVIMLIKQLKHCTSISKSIPCYCFIWNLFSYFPDFAASFLNPVTPFLLCRQCQGKDVPCTNGRCLSPTSPSHLKALSRSTTTQCMNTTPWLVVRPVKASPLLWWLNRSPEILHMIQVGLCFKSYLRHLFTGLSLCLVVASDSVAPDIFCLGGIFLILSLLWIFLYTWRAGYFVMSRWLK